MENSQRARTKGLAQPKADDALIPNALRKASAEAKLRATTYGVPFIVGKKKTWSYIFKHAYCLHTGAAA